MGTVRIQKLPYKLPGARCATVVAISLLVGTLTVACSNRVERTPCNETGGFASAELAMRSLLEKALAEPQGDLCGAIMKPISNESYAADRARLMNGIKEYGITLENVKISTFQMPDGDSQLFSVGSTGGRGMPYVAYEYQRKGNYRIALGNYIGVTAPAP